MDARELLYLVTLFAPFFTAFTCFLILFWSFFGVDRVECSARRVLMGFYFAIMVNWGCITFFLYLPRIVIPFIPLFCLCVLLVPILFYHYVHILTRVNSSERFSLFHYLFPFLVFAVLLIWSQFVPVELKLAAVLPADDTFVGKDYYYYFMNVVSGARLLIGLAYFVPTIRLLRRYREAVLNYSSDNERSSLHWLNALLVILLMLLLIPLTSVVVLWMLQRTNYINSIFIITSVVLVVYQNVSLLYNTLYRNFVVLPDEDVAGDLLPGEQVMANFLAGSNPETEFGTDTDDDAGLQKRRKELAKTLAFKIRFEECIEKKRPYLNPELKITDLTIHLHTNRSYLSAFINETYGMNFSRFINKYRLAEYERLRADADNRQFTNIHLIEKAGFTNYKGYLRARKYQQEEERG